MAIDVSEPRIQAAIAELQGLIAGVYPDVRFELSTGDDPPAVYIHALTPVDNTLEIADLISERELDMHLDEGLEVWVLPMFEAPAGAQRG